MEVSRICSGRRPKLRLGPQPGCAVSQVCTSNDVPCSFGPNSGLVGAEGCLCQEELFGKPLPDLVVDLHSTLFLQNCVAVVDTVNSQTLSEQGELRLRVLAELDGFMHRSDDVCLLPCSGAGPR